ncbi:MAG: hypothetical protein NC218_10875 [Acetobacter sp.]|nr:hypothetical protein [Acetobacter sp.]
MKDKLLLEQVKSKINKTEIISFDIFDTLLIRPYVHPTDLFLHLEKAFNQNGFANERRDAERRARIRHAELEDITLDMIYDEIDEEYKAMKQREMDWERMVLRANPELKQVYDYVKALGKKIVITSDMYLPTDFLASILRQNGFDGWDKLYVSGDIGKKKRTGSLFYHLLEEFHTSPKAVLHIGDNLEVDYNVAKVVGFRAQIVPNLIQLYINKNNKAKKFLRQSGNQLGSSILVSILAYRWQEQRCAGHKTNYWDELGYQYSGPLVYSFMKWLENEIKQSDIEHLLFVMRSGFVLKKVFDTFEPNIKTSYVYAPRVLKAACHLSMNYKDDYIKFIEYFANKNKVIKKRFEVIKDKSYHNLKLFFDVNRKLFENEAEKNKANYQKYMATIYNKEEKIALVDDMAVNFSAQFLIENTKGQNVQGFYFATLNLPQYNNFIRKSFAQTYTNKKIQGNEPDIWTYKWRFVEFLMGAPEVPTKDINENGIIYIDNANKDEKFRCLITQNMVDNAVLFANDIKKLFKGYDIFIDFSSIVQWINSYLLTPEKNDYEYMAKLTCDWKTFNTGHFDFLVRRPRLKDIFTSSHKTQNGINGTFFWPFRYQGILFAKQERDNMKKIKVLGLPYYSQTTHGEIIKTKKYFGLFKCYQDSWRKKTYVLGVCVKKKKIIEDTQNNDIFANRELIYSISRNVQRALTIATLHQKTFGEFRNKHNGQTIALVGAGPSVKFIKPLKNTIYVGLNRAFLLNNICFDYLFSIDKAGLDTGKEQYYEGFLNYDCIKFMGDQNLGEAFQIPQHIFYQDNKIRRYKTTAKYLPNIFAVDIDTEALANSCSCSIQAMQFILFTNPKKIYIYGIDCNLAIGQHFSGASFNNSSRGENAKSLDTHHIADWRRLKDFVATYYPETEIISVNPVGLKGIFHDVYTPSYLAKHPEIDAESVEILEED